MAELIAWPEAAQVNRLIPKDRLYTEAGASTALRHRFVDEVQRVHWAYKLGEESLRLARGENVTEIQVFTIDLKGADLHTSVLSSIDRAVPSQIIFELRREDGRWVEQAMAAAYKRTGAKTKGGDYLRTGWVSSDDPRVPMPTALDMDRLYEQLLGRLLPYPIRAGESLAEALARVASIRGLDREVAALERRMHSERQFNRKVELRTLVRAKQSELDELTKEPDRVPEDVSWRS